jgi:hypothetical protein
MGFRLTNTGGIINRRAQGDQFLPQGQCPHHWRH